MTQQLRDHLAHIADTSPALDVPVDAWSRGRRARRTDQLLAVATALALVVLLGGLTAFLVDGRTRIAPAGVPDGPGAVPATLYPVPTHVQTDEASYSSDLAVGQSAVAFVTDRGVPVVVSAADGSYRLLDLPGWAWTDPDLRARFLDPSSAQPLALSADGTRLAWGYKDPGDGTGIRIADLETGDLEEYPLRGAEDPAPTLSVTSVVFSGDSSLFAWSGRTDDPDVTWHGLQTGPDGYPAEHGPQDGPVTVGINNDGETLEYADGFARIPSTGGVGYDNSFRTDDLELPTPVASFSPDGDLILFGSALQQDHVDVGSIADGRVISRELPTDVYPHGAFVDPLGWVDDETAVVLGRTEDSSDRAFAHVALMTAPTVPEDEWTYEVVTRSESYTSFVSVAVDLLDRPTADHPAPDWPWSNERQAVLAGFALIGCSLLGLMVARRLRIPR